MISRIDSDEASSQQRRLLVIGHDSLTYPVAADLRKQLGEWSIGTSDSYLAGIASLAETPARAVLAFIDPSIVQLDNAVAGLREAAGHDTRLVLCCPPECEPLTRSVMQHGADDYLIYPLDPDEVSQAIGQPPKAPPVSPRLSEAPAASMDEMVGLAGLLEHLGDDPSAMFERMASLIQSAFHAQSVMIVVQGTVANVGDQISEPVITAPLAGVGETLGQITLGRRQHDTYTPSDVLKLTHYASVLTHIIEAAKHQRHLHGLATHDACSGLPNRRYFNDGVDGILQRAAARHFHVTLLLFDLDDFKSYNDTYGHDVGDEIIRSTGELFRKHCREQDIVARYGGDEFAVCFWDPQGPREAGSQEPDSAMTILDRVQAALKTQQLDHLGRAGVGKLTISGGIATFPWDGRTREELLKKADEALLAAKRAGKNRIFLIGSSNS